MPVRESMTDLIGRLRLLIGDVAGAAQVFSDQSLQDFLDRHRMDVAFEELEGRRGASGAFTDYFSTWSDWEADAKLYDSRGVQLSPTASDYLVGHWTFANQPPPVQARGKTYDIHAAAADALEAWAAKVKLEYHFTASGDSFHRDQKVQHLLELAKRHRAQARVFTTVAERSDWERVIA